MADQLNAGSNDFLSLLAPTQITSISLTQLLDISPDALIIANQAGTVVMVNQQTQMLFGYASNELLGLQIELLLPQRYRKAHGAHRELLPLHARWGRGCNYTGFARMA